MGEARNNKMALRKRIALEPRCIYCSNPHECVEHMPPRVLFRDRFRPKGLEFASCLACNNGTAGADLVVGYLARLSHSRSQEPWLVQDAKSFHPMLDRRAPGFRQELWRESKSSKSWLPGGAGILEPMMIIKADGEITRRHLTVFGAKLGMALYREHVGEALPLDGAVQVRSYLNAGLAPEQNERFLKTLPIDGELKMGKITVREQFAYRYNSDGKSILAAFVGFHSNFHQFIVAASDEAIFDELERQDEPVLVRPGDLVKVVQGGNAPGSA